MTEANFEDEVASARLFIEFYAPWCGHCRNLAPVWEQLAEKYASSEEVKIAKVDCTVNADLCKRYEIRGYPTLLFVRDSGDASRKYKGSRTLEDLSKFVEEQLKVNPSKCTDYYY